MARGGPSSSTSRGRGRRKPSPRKKKSDDDDDEIPEIYLEMLAEADARAADQPDIHNRLIKRRKIGERTTQVLLETPPKAVEKEERVSTADEDNASRLQQTVYDLDASDDDDSDMEWEEVEIQQQPSSTEFLHDTESDEPMQITLDKPIETPKKNVVARRKPVSAVEKKLRLDIHKVHLLCLLGHVHIRNLWCNDDEVQKFLKKMLSKQTITFLNPKESMPQLTRSRTFIDGLTQASEAFNQNFKVIAPGLRRPYWAEDPKAVKDRAEAILRDAGTILSKDDFRKQTKTLTGSRDFGAQLFCALLRSAAVEARLVCSLQPLPFSGVAKGMTSVKPKRNYIVISSDDHASSSDDRIRTQQNTPLKTRRLSRPQFTPYISRESPASRYNGPPPNVQGSSYPVFWVEALNEAVQKWIPVDPLVTKSVAKPSKFEPPASDNFNIMSYVVAFEDDASAKDITRRYAKAYNAKTRKTRVESTKNGEQWWTTAMNHFEKPFVEDRDQLEISELTAKSAAEPMPRNIQDFKDHPIYALERHLRRNEVIHPKRVIGQVALSKSVSKNEALEPIYRRADVHVVRSADGWYRLGRDIKIGEQPLKRTAASSTTRNDFGDEDEHLSTDTPMYALHQTQLYQPPPVVKGRIPKNVYGNLDVYVPSMVPPGGFHLRHPEAAQAARILGIDYADAVTGFEFKGRHGTAIFDGIVAATQYCEALEEVLRCLQDELHQAELDKKSAEALQLWKHFLLKLRIAEKVKRYAIEGEDAEPEQTLESEGMDEMDIEEGGGGFFPEADQEIAEPTSKTDDDEHGQSTDPDGYLSEQDDQDNSLGGGFMPEHETVEAHSASSSLAPAVKQTTSKSRKLFSNYPRYTLVVVPNEHDKITTAPSRHVELPTSLSGHANTSSRESNEPPLEMPNTAGQAEGTSDKVPITVDSSTGYVSNSASVEVLSQAPSQRASRGPSPQRITSDTDNNSDVQSMLSHDPEDEDAEPEWLLSD